MAMGATAIWSKGRRVMHRYGKVLKVKVLGVVLVAGLAVPAIATAQGPRYAQSEYRGSYSGYNNGGYSYGNSGYGNSGYDRGDGYYADRHDHHVGPGTGALIGAGAGALLGGILGGGKGALIGGGVGAGVGAIAGQANRNAQRNSGWNDRGWRNGGWNNGYGYSGSGYPNGYASGGYRGW